ncbi:hypothetical protein LINPERHAP1_LOCUS10673 [Linum perenne]
MNKLKILIDGLRELQSCTMSKMSSVQIQMLISRRSCQCERVRTDLWLQRRKTVH